MATTTHFKFAVEDGTGITIKDAKAGVGSNNVKTFAKAYAVLRPDKATQKIKTADKIVTSTDNISDVDKDTPIGSLE